MSEQRAAMQETPPRRTSPRFYKQPKFQMHWLLVRQLRLAYHVSGDAFNVNVRWSLPHCLHLLESSS